MSLYKKFKQFFGLYWLRKSQFRALIWDIEVFLGSLWWYFVLDRILFWEILPFVIPDNILELLFYLLVLTTVLFIYIVSFRAILKLNEENSYMLFFIRLTIYILSFLISFWFIYSFVDRIFPWAFMWIKSFFDYFYYSVVTFSTVWFWDISPNFEIAKIFTMWEIVSSYLFIVLVIWNVSKIRENLAKSNREAYLEAYEEREEK